MSGSDDALNTKWAADRSATSQPCPSSPNPVTSVTAWTPERWRRRDAAACRLSWRIVEVAAPIVFGSPEASAKPVPRGLDSTSASPGRAPPLVNCSPGATTPCTARPKIGSGERIVCPPATTPPASTTTSAAARKIAWITAAGRDSGNAAMLRASTTSPPMANTSLHALAAAMAPKSAGSSTNGGKKSVVDTRATPSATCTTAASSEGAKPTNRSALPAVEAAATSSPSSDAPHLAAQPPHEVSSVSRTGSLDTTPIPHHHDADAAAPPAVRSELHCHAAGQSTDAGRRPPQAFTPDNRSAARARAHRPSPGGRDTVALKQHVGSFRSRCGWELGGGRQRAMVWTHVWPRSHLLLDGEGVAVGVLEPRDLAAAEQVDPARVGPELRVVVPFEGHAVGAELVDHVLEVGDVPGGQRRGRLAGVGGRHIHVQRRPVSARVPVASIAGVVHAEETELPLVERLGPGHVGNRDRRAHLVAAQSHDVSPCKAVGRCAAPDLDASSGSTAAQSPKERQQPIAGQLVRALHVGLGQLTGQVDDRAPLTEHIAAPGASGQMLVNARPHVSGQGVLQVRGNELDELLARQVGRG